MKRKGKIIVYSILTAVAAASAAVSVYVETNYLSSDVVWQCLVGAVWTIASIVGVLLFAVKIFNAYFDTEKRIERTYSNAVGKERTFYYRHTKINADAVKTFLSDTDVPEEIYILSETELYAVFVETMDFASGNRFDLNTKRYEYDGQGFDDIDAAFERLKADGYIDRNNDITVIEYRYSTPTHLKKLICGEQK